MTNLLAGMTAVLDPKAVVAVNDAARLELENNQFALPLPGMAGSGGALGGVGKRGTGAGETNRQRLGLDPRDELSADDNIALRLTQAWNALFGVDSGPEGAAGPLETPAVPPGGDTRVPGYPGDSRQSEQTLGYESDQGNLGTPGLQADSNKHQGGSVTPLPEQQGPRIILNETSKKDGLLLTNNRATKIFGSRDGHIADTPENRELLLNVAEADKAIDVGKIGAKGSTGAESAINQGRLNSQLLAEEVASGHAFQKHVVERQEFADLGIRTKSQFQSFVEKIVSNPAIERRQAVDGTDY